MARGPAREGFPPEQEGLRFRKHHFDLAPQTMSVMKIDWVSMVLLQC